MTLRPGLAAAPPPFASGRDVGDRIAEQAALVSGAANRELFDDFPTALLFLNSRRQIVYLNAAARRLLVDGGDSGGAARDGAFLGRRLGEAFGCVGMASGCDGCGSGDACRFCGAARSLQAALNGRTATQDCALERRLDGHLTEQLDVQVWSKPCDIGGQPFLFVGLLDRSSEKRRDNLERIFLHDVMNTAGSISSLFNLIDPAEPDFGLYLEMAKSAAEQLVEEIIAQRALSEAERGSLEPDLRPVDLAETIAGPIASYAKLGSSRGVAVDSAAVAPVAAVTDPVLVRRVIGNLLKNALEATDRGQTVAVALRRVPGAGDGSGYAEIAVANPAAMSETTKANLFKRFYSTKGQGRGIGTYAARLFVEDYLGGSLSCESAPETGTVFTVRLPLPVIRR